MSNQIGSDKSPGVRTHRFILLSSFGAAVSVFTFALLLQWAVYSNWLHDRGPLRLFGSLLAAGLGFGLCYSWQESERQRQIRALRFSSELHHVQDRVRNSLQAIVCVTYARAPETAEPVKTAVDLIENTLEEAFRATPQGPFPSPPKSSPVSQPPEVTKPHENRDGDNT